MLLKIQCFNIDLLWRKGVETSILSGFPPFVNPFLFLHHPHLSPLHIRFFLISLDLFYCEGQCLKTERRQHQAILWRALSHCAHWSWLEGTERRRGCGQDAGRAVSSCINPLWSHFITGLRILWTFFQYKVDPDCIPHPPSLKLGHPYWPTFNWSEYGTSDAVISEVGS